MDKATEWYVKAAKGGNKDAMNYLGMCYKGDLIKAAEEAKVATVATCKLLHISFSSCLFHFLFLGCNSHILNTFFSRCRFISQERGSPEGSG